MKKLILISCLVSLLGCGSNLSEEEREFSNKFVTVGFGTEEYREEVRGRLEKAGVPFVVGSINQRGFYELSWPKEFNEIADRLVSRIPPELQNTELTTMDFGPASFRSELKKKLESSGIPYVEHPPNERGNADFSWPKKYDSVVNKIIGLFPKLEMPEMGGILAVGVCSESNDSIQLWQTKERYLVMKLGKSKNPEVIFSEKYKDFPYENIEKYNPAVKECKTLKSKFILVFPEPENRADVESRLSRFDIQGGLSKFNDGFFIRQ